MPEKESRWPKVGALWVRRDGTLVREGKDDGLTIGFKADEDIRRGERFVVFLNEAREGKELHAQAPTHVVCRTPNDSGPRPEPQKQKPNLDDVPF